MPGDFKKRTGSVGQPTVLKSTDTVAATDDLVGVFIGGGSVTVSASDIEIGAVELKNGTTDDRAKVYSTGEVSVRPEAPGAIYCGSKTVLAAGVPVVLAAAQALKRGVVVQALTTNTGLLKVGNASATPIWLSAGGSVSIEINDLGAVYVDTTVNNEGCTYLAS